MVTPSQAAVALGVGLALAPAAQAATFTVTNLDDAGAGSLRQAIADANVAPGADVINFQAGLTGTITLTTGKLEVTDSVDIQGPGNSALTVDGNNASGVFHVYNYDAVLDVTISGLTVTRGSPAGGIFSNGENLTLDGLRITECLSAIGGGISSGAPAAGSITIRNSDVYDNTAQLFGGGIAIFGVGSVLIQNTRITGNQAFYGGGLTLYYGSATVEDCTISGNTASAAGGGILGILYDPTTIRRTTVSGNTAAQGAAMALVTYDSVLIENSTVSGNRATGLAGGIFAYLSAGSCEIRHSTISENSASTAGGGIYADDGNPILDHCIVANNTAASNNDLGNDTAGGFDLSFTLVESPGTAVINDNGGNILNQDPQLGPLADNGGPTLTHLPAAGSPAINAGDSAFTPPPSTDQRGLARVGGGRTDMGAVEINPGTIQFAVGNTDVGENAGAVTITVTRTGGSDGDVSVTAQTANGSAVEPGDYTAASQTLTWLNGDNDPKTFEVTIQDDAEEEPAETINLSLTGTPAILGTPATATITIAESDVPPPPPGSLSFTAAAITVNEDDGTVTVSVQRTGGSSGPASVEYATSNGTAIDPSDYQETSGILSWADGDSSPKSFDVAVLGDFRVEPTETINLTLSNATGAGLGSPSTAVISIEDGANQGPGGPQVIPLLDNLGLLGLGSLLSALSMWVLRRRRNAT